MDMQIFFLSLPVFSCGRLRCAKTARKQVTRQKHFSLRQRDKLDSFDDETLTMPPLQQNDGQPCVGKMKNSHRSTQSVHLRSATLSLHVERAARDTASVQAWLSYGDR